MRFSNSNKLLVLVLVLSMSGTALAYYNSGHHGDMEHQREHYIAHKDAMIHEQIQKGDYACCLVKPCAYCLEKTPGHGEGATCNCLDDVVNGRHPCGECIGEILEGHGNPFLAEYFARAIAEEVGEKYYTPLAQIMSDKYGISLEDQLTFKAE